jgi:membrane protease YdiL (CAAX protease family)
MPYDSTALAPSPIQSAPPPPLPDAQPKLIAPVAHMIAIFSLLVVSTWYTSTHAAARALAGNSRVLHYLGSIGLEWMLLGLVMLGIYRRRDFLRMAFLNRSQSLLQSIGLGFAVYIVGLMSIAMVSSILIFTPLFQHRNEALILAMVPHTPIEYVVWFGVSLTAAVCEELIFRGYLLQQLIALTGRPIVSVVLAALLFGSVHLYEGLSAVLPLAALALVYGSVVRYCKGDLRAVVVAHTLQDFVVAFLILARPYLEHYQPKP